MLVDELVGEDELDVNPKPKTPQPHNPTTLNPYHVPVLVDELVGEDELDGNRRQHHGPLQLVGFSLMV